jgi:predicted dehydrogenase
MRKSHSCDAICASSGEDAIGAERGTASGEGIFLIRLAVSGLEPSVLHEVAARLRGAEVVAGDETGRAGAGEPVDATAFVSTRHDTKPLVEPLLRAGHHVMLAAHPTLRYNTLSGLGDVARQSGARLVVTNPDHYLPSRRLIKQQLDAGKLGEIGLLRWHRWEPRPRDRTGDSPGVTAAAWRDLELVLWYLDKQPNIVYAQDGAEAENVTAAGAPADGDAARGDGFRQLHLGFPGGSMALVDYSDALPSGDGYTALHIIGATGAAYADDHSNMQLLFQGGHPQGMRAEEGIQGAAAMLQDFVDAIRADRETSAELAVWRRVEAVAEAVARSVRTRRAIQPEVV